MSQTARILGVLQDGRPHLVSEIHERSGYSRLNSRISDLRARGFVIECFHVPSKTGSEGYGYTLISEPSESAESEPCGLPPSSPSPRALEAHPVAASDSAEQLSLVPA